MLICSELLRISLTVWLKITPMCKLKDIFVRKFLLYCIIKPIKNMLYSLCIIVCIYFLRPQSEFSQKKLITKYILITHNSSSLSDELENHFSPYKWFIITLIFMLMFITYIYFNEFTVFFFLCNNPHDSRALTWKSAPFYVNTAYVFRKQKTAPFD